MSKEFGHTGHYGLYMGNDYERTEWGWNVRHCRPATKEEVFYKSYETCMCELCSSNCHYSAFYCGRMKQAGWIMMLEREYWKSRNAAKNKAV